MLALCANTKKHLEALARGRDLAEISPRTGASSGKRCAVYCSYCQGYLNLAGMVLPLAWRKSVLTPAGCLDIGREAPGSPAALSLAPGSLPRPGPCGPGAPLFLVLEGLNIYYHEALSPSAPQILAGTRCKDCKCKSDLSKWQHLVC